MNSQQTQAQVQQAFQRPKNGASIVYIGRQGAGKTPAVKTLAEGSGFDNLVAYDPNREYDPETYTVFYSLETFKRFLVSDECRECFIIIEEATTFLSGFRDFEISDMIVKIQHKLNVCAFLFHSYIDASPFVLTKSRFAVLMPTNDEPKDVERARAKFYKYYLESRENYREDSVGSGDIYIDLNQL